MSYALERFAERSQAAAPSGGGAGGRSEGVSPGGTSKRRVFLLHLASFLVYNAIIVYTLPLNYRTNIPFAVLFTVAMGLHFVLSDRGLEEHYGRLFDRWPPRLLLAGGLLLGWLLAALFAPTASVTISLLTAFLAGSILLNVFKEEIPSTRRSSLAWFTAGLVLYAALLLGVTLLEGAGNGGAEGQAAAAMAAFAGPGMPERA